MKWPEDTYWKAHKSFANNNFRLQFLNVNESFICTVDITQQMQNPKKAHTCWQSLMHTQEEAQKIQT